MAELPATWNWTQRASSLVHSLLTAPLHHSLSRVHNLEVTAKWNCFGRWNWNVQRFGIGSIYRAMLEFSVKAWLPDCLTGQGRESEYTTTATTGGCRRRIRVSGKHSTILNSNRLNNLMPLWMGPSLTDWLAGCLTSWRVSFSVRDYSVSYHTPGCVLLSVDTNPHAATNFASATASPIDAQALILYSLCLLQSPPHSRHTL